MPIGQQQGGDIRLVQDVGELMSAVGWVDVDEGGTDAGGRELRDDPLRPVGGPDADVFATLDAKGEQSTSDLADMVLKLSVAAAVSKLAEDEGVAVTAALGGPCQHLS